jgi:hypothetical protein
LTSSLIYQADLILVKNVLRSLANHVFEKRLAGMNKFKNIHAGETCYIFGDGPSISWIDFSKLSDKPAICCGMIPFHKDFRLLDIRYASLIEPWLFCPDWIKRHNYLKELSGVSDRYREVIDQNRDVNFFAHLSNSFSLKGDNVSYVNNTLVGNEEVLASSLRGMNLFAGSFHATLAIAFHLGFTSVYLVGFDAWTLYPSKSGKWYEKGMGEDFDATNHALDYLSILKNYMDIYTVSISGSSKNLEAINYENLTGSKAKYKENYELMDKKYLLELARCTEYNIF